MGAMTLRPVSGTLQWVSGVLRRTSRPICCTLPPQPQGCAVTPSHHRLAVLLCLLATWSTPALAARMPCWFSTDCHPHQSKTYLHGVGVGQTQEEADQRAKAAIGEAVELRLRTYTEVQLRMNSTGGDTPSNAFSTALTSNTQTASNVQLSGIVIRERVKRRKQYYALASVSRRTAAEALDTQLAPRLSQLNQRLRNTDDGTPLTDPIQRFNILQSELAFLTHASTLSGWRTAIAGPGDVGEMTAALVSEHASLANNIPIALAPDTPPDLMPALLAVLTSNGFNPAPDAVTHVHAHTDVTHQPKDRFGFFRAQVRLTVTLQHADSQQVWMAHEVSGFGSSTRLSKAEQGAMQRLNELVTTPGEGTLAHALQQLREDTDGPQ